MNRIVIGLVACVAATPVAADAQTVADDSPLADRSEAAPVTPIANLSARLAYNTDTGAVAGLGVTTDGLFGSDAQLSFNIEASEQDTRLSFGYDNESIFGESPAFGLGVVYAESLAGEVYDFDATILRLEPRLTWRPSETLRFSAYLSLAHNEIGNVPTDSSALIRADEGEQDRVALGMQLAYATQGDNAQIPSRILYGFGLEVGGTSRDHSFAELTGSVAARHGFGGGNVVLSSQVRAGALYVLEGTSNIGDRFMLGAASIRGFAFGGFGPRDLAVDGDPALGGNYYAVARFDLQFPNAVRGSLPRVTPGLFVDVGSLWGLDDVGGGTDGSSEVDDDLHLRGSIGLSVQFETGIGPIRLNVAHPFASEESDRTQSIGLTFSRRF
jgi:outer membrane protein insertion porin family